MIGDGEEYKNYLSEYRQTGGDEDADQYSGDGVEMGTMVVRWGGKRDILPCHPLLPIKQELNTAPLSISTVTTHPEAHACRLIEWRMTAVSPKKQTNKRYIVPSKNVSCI